MTESMRACEPSGDEARGALARAVTAIREAVTIATVLRTLGALATVLSLSLYLMQGFETRDHLGRVYVLLGQSGLLALAGLAIGYFLEEPKGARVFLTLALASVPANVAVLGAMIYSIAPLDGLLPGTAALAGDYPAYAFWEASGPGDLLRALVPGAALLVPVTLFGFSVLARRFAGSLSFALLAGSALLLVPLRDPLATALLGGATLIVPILALRRARMRAELRARPVTFEERLAGALLLLPSLIVLGRATLGHGAFDAHAALPLLLGLWYVLHRAVRGGTGTSRWRHLAALGSGVSRHALGAADRLAVRHARQHVPGAAAVRTDLRRPVPRHLARRRRLADPPLARRAVERLGTDRARALPARRDTDRLAPAARCRVRARHRLAGGRARRARGRTRANARGRPRARRRAVD